MRPIKAIPVLDWARAYRTDWLRLDLLAGVTTAAVVIPKAMAYATIAGLPVQVGLYTALVPLVVYALLGTSRALSVTTTTTLAILAGAQLALAVPDGSQPALLTAASTLAVLTGAALILAWVLRLGFLANFISEPVLTGFKAGVGVVIVVDQIPKLLGIHFPKAGFLHNALQTVAHLPHTSMPTLLLGLATLALIFWLERVAPRAPVPLIAVALGVAASAFGLRDLGVETVGAVATGLPVLAMPDWSLAETLWPGALGIALMSYTESVAAMRAFVRRGEPRPDPNQELFALGMANVGAGLFGGMPAGGGTTQTAVNRKVGACTQVSGLATAAVALATLLLLAPLIGLMPQATLAAIVIAYSIELVSVAEFLVIRRIRTTEFRWALVATVGIVLLGTLKGIVVAVIVSLAALAQQTSNPPVYAMARKRGSQDYRPVSARHPDDELVPGLLIVRIEGRIYFGNAERVADKVHQLIVRYQPKVLVLDCRAIFDLEFTALSMLTQAEAALRDHGITLWIVAPNPGVMQVLERAPLGKTLGPERIFRRLHTAVRRYQELAPQPDAAGPSPAA